jgi:type I restriction enzyme M protein
MADHLGPEGKAAIVVPEGLLFGSTGANLKLKKMLVEDFNILGVISMPAGVFRPYAGVKTSVIIFSKTKPQKKVWFYELQNDGFSLDEKRSPINENDIPDLLEKWNDKSEANKSWSVDIDKIRNDDYNLTAARYKPHKVEEIEFADPREIIDNLINIEKEITQDLKNIKDKISD